MEISDWIETNLKKVSELEYTRREAYEIIGQHPKLQLVYMLDKSAGFKIESSFGNIHISIGENMDVENYQLETILREVSFASGIPQYAMKTRSRKREIVEARQAYMIIAESLKVASLERIGEFVERDHTTVLHAKKQGHLESIKLIIRKTRLKQDVC